MIEPSSGPFRQEADRPGGAAWIEPLESRVLLSTWWIAGHIGGADWVGGIGGGISGGGLTVTGSYQSDDWFVNGQVSAGSGGVVGAVNAGTVPPGPGAATPPAPTGPVAGDGSELQVRFAAGLAGGRVEGTITLEWTGGAADAAMDVWRLGPDGWQREGINVAAAKGRFEWQPWQGPEGWQAFATVDGEEVTLTAPTLSRGAVALADLPDWDPGQPVALRAEGDLTVLDRSIEAGFRLEWDAWDRPAAPPAIDLWTRGPLGRWRRLTGAGGISAAEGSFTWNTTSASAGWHGVWATLAGAGAPVLASTDLIVQIL